DAGVGVVRPWITASARSVPRRVRRASPGGGEGPRHTGTDCPEGSHALLHCLPNHFEDADIRPGPDMTIKRRDFLKKAGTGAAGAVALGACGGGGPMADGGDGTVEGPQVSWRLATSFPPSLDILHGAGVRIAERVSELTGGNFAIRVYAAGEIVPALQVMDAVMQGTVQCGVSPGYYYQGKNPALAFDTAIPFGLSTRQQYAWLHH